MRLRLLIVFLLPLLMLACKKWSDPTAQTDPRITERHYCNDPGAVNYNWNFPGVPDNSTCFYPSEVFKGTYLYKDSVYSSTNVFDSAASLIIYTLQLIPLDHSRFIIKGFCLSNDSLKFTAERTSYRANADTTFKLNDTTSLYGQPLCRIQDTLTGYLTKDRIDSTKLYLELTVQSDTGINFHRGTAIKQ
jgi:hypothetical protein